LWFHSPLSVAAAIATTAASAVCRVEPNSDVMNGPMTTVAVMIRPELQWASSAARPTMVARPGMSAHQWTPVGVRCRSRMASEPPSAAA
jgi:hypothetical protein